MNLPSIQDASPVEYDWLAVAHRIEQAQRLQDPLMALAWLADVEDQVKSLVGRALQDGVRQAREAGKTWAEIEIAFGLDERSTARQLVTYAEALSGDDPLWALSQLSKVENGWQVERHQSAAGAQVSKRGRRGALDRMMQAVVEAARHAGRSWDEIAAANGVQDRQTAWRRWRDRGIE